MATVYGKRVRRGGGFPVGDALPLALAPVGGSIAQTVLIGKLRTFASVEEEAMWYSTAMPDYYWDEEKDALLRRTRGISFIEITYAIEHGGLLDAIDHPNPALHPGQRIYVVRIGDYAYRVPFEVTASGIFLRTIYPSGVDTRYYLR